MIYVFSGHWYALLVMLLAFHPRQLLYFVKLHMSGPILPVAAVSLKSRNKKQKHVKGEIKVSTQLTALEKSFKHLLNEVYAVFNDYSTI